MAGEMKAEISPEFVGALGDKIKFVMPEFDIEAFSEIVLLNDWEDVELKARIQRVAEGLGQSLSQDFPVSVEILKKVAPEYGGLQSLVFPEFIEKYGLKEWDVSMDALAFFTCFGSSEFAVRPFIRLDEERMMRQMLNWAESGDMHVRRLASEGCRPKLPWASPLRRFIADPKPVLPILERLKNDPEEYVRRSVANNLNDISKDHESLTLDIGARWLGLSKGSDRVVKHGLRTLLKRGDERALQLFGYGDPELADIVEIIAPASVAIGGRTNFGCVIEVGGVDMMNVRLEYAVDFLKANGAYSQKVFQWREATLEPGLHKFKKRHSFRQMTTRKHYAGEHVFNVVVNGRVLKSQAFQLLEE